MYFLITQAFITFEVHLQFRKIYLQIVINSQIKQKIIQSNDIKKIAQLWQHQRNFCFKTRIFACCCPKKSFICIQILIKVSVFITQFKTIFFLFLSFNEIFQFCNRLLTSLIFDIFVLCNVRGKLSWRNLLLKSTYYNLFFNIL